jgi:hypothetical protein
MIPVELQLLHKIQEAAYISWVTAAWKDVGMDGAAT